MPCPRVDIETDALIAEDVQNDFCPGGALAVPRGDEVVPVLNRWMAVEGLLKFASRDWHPRDHCSFKAQGGPWPPHCVQGTSGADFHKDFRADLASEVISKAFDPKREAYSTFDVPRLLETLRASRIKRLWIGGLATEYCVKSTALDGREHGFEVFLIEDAVRGVEVSPGDSARAVREMQDAGVRVVRTDDVLGPEGPQAGSRQGGEQ